MCQFCSNSESRDLENYFETPNTATSTKDSNLDPQQAESESPTQEWLKSIDSVYSLFEDMQIRDQYPDLANKVEIGVRLCEEVIEELG